jgi:transcriptional regulator with XRE-family HTH domain
MSRIRQTSNGTLDWSAIADRLREIRGTTNQVDLGAELGVTQNVVSRYERGRVRPPLEYLASMAAHGKVTLDWLIEGKSPKQRS